ncbi:phosphoenolpyruvate--protein phosphotransferase [Salinicola avicenniae]|uniref:phosphoenolpyruvate--protein phosphotransferase n=1 Tax=Salinicola avicenniae TaxID=2916836 RepID=UPI002074440A|nr:MULTISPECIES: phosphoenolpyruvate--protein phosphotransferase [unclassified Salinicola]
MSRDTFVLQSPLTGIVVPLAEVPDPVFSGGTLGPGLAIDPLGETLHAPCDGEIVHCARTGHAFTLRDVNGFEWLLHLGLETVALEGDGLTPLVAEGDSVAAGDVLCRFDADRVACRAKALITPMILINGEGWQCQAHVSGGSRVMVGEALLGLQRELGRQRDAQSSAPLETPDLQISDARVVTVALSAGIHARPAARLRAIAREQGVTLTVARSPAEPVDVASLSALLHLGVVAGEQVTLTAYGAQATVALAAAAELLNEVELVAALPVDATGHGLPELGEGRLSGLVASAGMALGPLVPFAPPLPEVPTNAADPAVEREALHAALAVVGEALAQARRQARRHHQVAEGDIFEAHLAWLEDPDLLAAAEQQITAGRSAGRGWYEALEAEARRLRASDNALLAARAEDLRDLQRQVMAHFACGEPDGDTVPEGAILVARELTPSQFVAVAERLAGLCLVAGGTTSHVAILARARNLPCLVAMGEVLLEASSECAYLEAPADAPHGTLEISPDVSRQRSVEAWFDQRQIQVESARAAAFEIARTRDGQTVEVAANVGSAADAVQAAKAGADGVGLMRSEFLFLGRETPPDGEIQRREYAQVVDALGGRPVIVRMLDLGADKQLPYLTLPKAPNPALGVRGIRLWQWQPELFETQLDALLEAGRGRKPASDGRSSLRIMLPMISDAGELRWVRERLAARADTLGIETLPALGAMVEVPAAALAASCLAREADFLSIGTNDLTQYALAMDREATELAARADVLHPGVLRLIQACVEGAGEHCPVGVCGAAAGDPLAGMVLVAMGVNELSVEPARVAAVKASVRELDAGRLRRALPELLALDDSSQVRRALRRLLDDMGMSPGDSSASAPRRDATTTRS